MRIGESKTVAELRRAQRKAGAAHNGAFSALVGEDSEASDASTPASHGVGVSGLSSLLALQMVEGEGEIIEREGKEKRARAIADAEDALTQLEEIRNGLMMGAISLTVLNRAQETVLRIRRHAVDPQLTYLLNDIELRVQVELAKLGLV